MGQANFVQGTGAQSVGTVASFTKAFPSNVTTGNAIAVGAGANTASLTTTSISDTVNMYTNVDINNQVGAGQGECASYFAKNVTGGTLTIKVTPSVSDFVNISIAEFSGVDLSSPLDGHNVGSSNNTSLGVSTGSWTSTANGVIFGHFMQNFSTTTITESGAGVTQIAQNTNGTNGIPFDALYILDNSPGAGKAAGVWTTGADRPGNYVGFSLKAAVGGATKGVNDNLNLGLGLGL